MACIPPDISINELFTKKTDLDISINELFTKKTDLDISINELFTKKTDLDILINELFSKKTDLDISINELFTKKTDLDILINELFSKKTDLCCISKTSNQPADLLSLFQKLNSHPNLKCTKTSWKLEMMFMKHYVPNSLLVKKGS